MAEKRKSYNTTLRADLTKRLRILAAQQGKRQNDLLEEAIKDLFDKYESESQVTALSPVQKTQKRKHPRAEVSWPVNLITSQGLFDGEIKNISKGGALIQCRDLPEVEESLELSIEIPDHLLSISATVEKVRLNIDERNLDLPMYDLAVRFSGIDVDQRTQLYDAIDEQVYSVAY
jgi:predicted DNA-binding protein